METKIISVANHKGGVGKTTTVASVGSILASQGHRVLMSFALTARRLCHHRCHRQKGYHCQ